LHDTYFVVAHFHYTLISAVFFGGFTAMYYWFPKMFGRMMNELLGKIHFIFTFVFFNLTFFPMHFLGVGGHMRRIYEPHVYEFLARFQGMNTFVSVCALVLGASQIFFLVNFIWSLFAGRRAGENPWQANTLEWTAPSPPPHGNFLTPPVVYRGPYEYSVPEVAEDWLPQTRQLEIVPRSSHG
jgi:cytochrome c oxidase subunit 1